MSDLILGPLLRHVDETTAAIWVEVAGAGEVEVVAGELRARSRTFAVHGHHFALVEVEGLTPGTRTPYVVNVDGQQVWPEPDSAYPPPLIATLDHSRPPRLAFGSCRTSVPHDEEGNRTHGVDALRALALDLAGGRPHWPDLVLFLGDQVYADETTQAMREFIESRRNIDEPPGTELQDFEEYAHLYSLAWSDPANRWLLSTLQSLMIFDDHDIRDDWNTSQTWKDQMEATTWWHGRIIAGLASYWVYQHLGNLAPEDRALDEVWQRIRDHEGPDEFDASDLLDALADRADQHPETYRWSYGRDFGTHVRLIVVDSRAARVLEPEHRAMLDPGELAWLDEHLTGDFDHLLIGTSLPFLMARGLHHVEAFAEALARGAWGRRASRVGEWGRQSADLEHWPAFQRTFQQVSELILEVARGERGRPPHTVIFLSGDVHHSFVSEARPVGGRPIHSRIIQACCSPIRNPLPKAFRLATAVMSYGVADPVGRLVALSAKVPDAPFTWRMLHGPWFQNNLATLDIDDHGVRLRWATGEADAGADPVLENVADVHIDTHPR